MRKLLRDYPNREALDRAAFQRLYEQMEKEGRSTQAAPIAIKLGRSREAADALLKSRIAVWRQIPGWDGHPEMGERARWRPDGTLTISFQSMLIDDLSTLSGLPVCDLNLSYTRVSDLRPLQGMRLHMLSLVNLRKLTDLSPLKGMPLEVFNAAGTGHIERLVATRGHEAETILRRGREKLRELSPLKGMPLENIERLHWGLQL